MTRANSFPAIYRIENVVTGRSYVGSSRCVHTRWIDHLIQLRAGLHDNANLQDSVTRHGITSLRFSLLEVLPTDENLTDREAYWMHELNPEQLYNQSILPLGQ